ncbi:uncharacterized protein LOC134696751 [Mytilus trossulus]|uniref:uncharacterized protein LOC134696751 n=1 Tax=Mytilus trossulus TaxID=6551 RepID=UPI0030052D21
MRRDVVPKSTVPSSIILSNNLEIINNTSSINTNLHDSDITDQRYLLEKEFYKTYDPNVGFNTALVLGVMLSALLLYVIYRTKIRKPLLAFVKRQFYEFRHRGMPREVASLVDIEVRDNVDNNDNDAGDTADGNDEVFYDEVEKTHHDKTYHLLPTFSISDDDKQLPIVVMDMKSATADWVQQQHNFLEPGTFILKVKSDTICPQGKEINPSKVHTTSNIPGARSQHCLSHARTHRQYIHNCKYSNALNQSLPTLKTQDSIRSSESDVKPSKKTRLKNTKHQSMSSEPKSPMPHSHISKPVHLTPIIKIQNYDKSQRTTIDKREDRDSVSSSSSDDPQILRITADNWNKNKQLKMCSSQSVDRRDDTCPYCETTSKIPVLKQFSLDIPNDKHNILVPVIDYTGTSRSCQNITSMETTL